MRRTAEDIHDEWLVLRSQSGDESALPQLVDRWHGRLTAHARRLTGDADAAREASQEAWLAIVRGLPRLNDPARFAPWAYRILTYKCRDWIRRRSRDRARGLRHQSAAGAETSIPAPTPDQSADEPMTAVRAAMRRLSADHRAVLDLHYLDGLGVMEIALALGVPAGTVKSRLHHARGRLRAIIESHSERIES